MKLSRILTMAAIASVLALSVGSLSAQDNNGGTNTGDRQSRRNRGGDQGGPGGGNFDPAQFQQRMMERLKTQLEVADDTEWKALEPMITKVNEARMAARGGFGGFGGGRSGRGGGTGGDQGGTQRRFGPEPSAEEQALQKAIDAKAPNAEIKAALDKFVAARKAKQAELEKAQAALRKVLTPRQEAIAALNGLL